MATRDTSSRRPRRRPASRVASPPPPRARARAAQGKASASQAQLLQGVQQVWLAGMGAVARAQKEGPTAFQDAVVEGLRVLNQSRSVAQRMVRDAFDSAQETLQSRVGGAREQAQETMDNLEALFQQRVQRAMHQLGVPTAEEIRVLTRRVAELNDSVKRINARERGGKGAAGPQRRAGAQRPRARRAAKGGRERASARGGPAMLDLQPATVRPVGSARRFGLALAGGGPLGAFYEIGCLHAIEEALDGYELTELEMYVGVSSGAMVAAGLANGFDTADMGLVFIHNESSELKFSPSWFLLPAFREYARRLASVPGMLMDIAREYLRDPGKNWAEAIYPIGSLLPTGICDNRPLERLLGKLFSGPGRTNDFRRLAPRLYVVATDLNTGHSVRFGEPGFDHIPISRAIQASTALPGLYPPVTIDGHVYADGALLRTMNASVLLEAGADFVVCVNPLVAFDASSAPRPADGYPPQEHNLTHGGLPTVLSQTFRSLIQSRMQAGMKGYKQRFPGADVLLFEPERGDADLFFQNVFSYRDREQLAEHAYQRTRRDLRSQAPGLQKMLRRHGITLRMDILADQHRTYARAVDVRKRRQLPLVGPLHHTLDRLERVVAQG